MRRILLSGLILTTIVLAPAGIAAQSDPGTPLSIEGANATLIVHTPAGTGALAVIAGSTLYEYGGGDWQPTGTNVPDGLAVWSAGVPGVILVGDHAPCLRGGPAIDFRHSDDGGASWATVDGASDFRPLAVWEESGLALAASCAGLQLSRDGGLTWEVVPGIEHGWEITAFAEVSGAGSGPVVLLGLTGEGGTSYLHRVDFSDPDVPVVSADLRMYYAIGGLAGTGETYLLAAMDGVWVSRDAGATWSRMATGLDQVVLEQDPAVYGLPEDFDPAAVGLFSVAVLPGERGGALIGSVDGLYLGTANLDRFTKVADTAGRVEDVRFDGSGTLVLYLVDGVVYSVPLPE